MIKRIISSMLTFLIIFTMLPNVVSAEENKNYADDLVSVDSTEKNLFEVQVIDSSGKVLANGRMTVYSYLENKTVGEVFLDDNGKTSFVYQPSMSLIEKDLANRGAVDVHYAIFVTNGEEVFVDGFTQTYYSPDFFEEKDSLSAGTDSYSTDNVKTDNVKSLKIKTKKVKDDKNFKVAANDSAGTMSLMSEGTITILETRDLGYRPTDFIVANSAKGCTVEVNIVRGNKVTLSGGSILSTGFTATSTVETGATTTTASSGVKYKFFTYYQYVEEKVRWTDGVSTITYHQIRPTAWKSGIGYVTFAESKNEVSPGTLAPYTYTTYTPGSYAKVTVGKSFTIGGAAAFTGPLSGINYKVDVNHTVYSDQSAKRTHGSTTYYEYGGNGSPVTELYVTRY
ncbi:MAG: hypothetical protein K0R54_4550 [Clostridiaceae bacterium]|jgi:hypothetical protein|uniref:hypothetical protein n=1 Tax=Clostridium sp. TaxID=1506 RepID=UPI00258EFE97|nr:hypothetical protein [Clostridium sp.]MDF2504999.1 hypothetical protein [Clostridium sp.]MDF2883984.1 hypothetical protein [Clostridiaceae bacterium]